MVNLDHVYNKYGFHQSFTLNKYLDLIFPH